MGLANMIRGLSDGWRLVILAVLGVGSRLVFFAMTTGISGANKGGDASFYLAMARNLKDYGVYGVGLKEGYYRPPLYSAFLYTLSFLPGDWDSWIVVVQCATSIVVTILAYFWLKDWDRTAAFVWALAWITSPFQAFSDFLINQESLYTSLMICLAAFLFKNVGHFTFRNAISFGLMGAALVWVRDVYMFLPFALAIVIVLVGGLRALRPAMLGLAVFVLATSPWILRNASLPNGGFFMSKGIAGLGLFVGTWQRDGNWNPNWAKGENLPIWAILNEDNRERLETAVRERNDAVLTKEALERYRTIPLTIFSNYIRRLHVMWFGTRSDSMIFVFKTGSLFWYLLKVFLFSLNTLVTVLGILGILFIGLRLTPLLAPTSCILYVMLIYMPFGGMETRYSIGALPLLYLLAVTFLAWIIRRFDFAARTGPLELRTSPGWFLQT